MQTIAKSNKIADIISKGHFNDKNVSEDIKAYGEDFYFDLFEYIERNYRSTHSQRYSILKHITQNSIPETIELPIVHILTGHLNESTDILDIFLDEQLADKSLKEYKNRREITTLYDSFELESIKITG